ncbi:MAG: alpha-ketoacid dehydrogenase subunit beta [Candidatus Omnitrophota bacterium]
MAIKEVTFREAVRQALFETMKRDAKVFIMGCGVNSPDRIFGSIYGLEERFGKRRILETPLAENGMTGIAIGAALTGMRPVMIYQRIDFALLAMDQIINHAAKWHYMFAGKMNVPLTIRGVIGGRWGQGAQHSQSLQALFVHVPGLKVVMPSNPYDAKGLLISSIKDNNPVVFLEHRLLYERKEKVPSGYYTIPLGKARIVKKGKDITVVAVSIMVHEAKKAALKLKREDRIDIEIIDPRCLRPLDKECILDSVKKTGRLIIADTGWKTCGISAEISALLAEYGFGSLKAPVKRIGLPEAPAPTSVYLENIYYPGSEQIIRAARELFYTQRELKNLKSGPIMKTDFFERKFTGPF